MVPFIILLTVPLVIYPFSKNVKINGYRLEQFPLLFFFLMLTFLTAFRHQSIGNDTSVYIYFYRNISGVPWDQVTWGSLEIGFQFYMKLLSMISPEPQFFIAVSSIVVCALIYPTYKRLCVDPSLTIVIFCILSTFVMMFSGIRQMMAVSIGFLAYEFTRKGKWYFFIPTVVFATLFHTSAFMLAFMYPVFHLRLTKKWLLAIVPVLFAIFIFNKPIFSFLAPFLGEVTRFEVVMRSTGAYSMLFLLLAFTVFSFLIPDESAFDEETLGLRNLLLLSLVLQFFVPLNFLAMRMNYYYIIFIPLLLPKIIQYSRVKWQQFALVGRYIMVIFFFIYFIYSGFTSPYNLHVFPYHFFWENVVV